MLTFKAKTLAAKSKSRRIWTHTSIRPAAARLVKTTKRPNPESRIPNKIIFMPNGIKWNKKNGTPYHQNFKSFPINKKGVWIFRQSDYYMLQFFIWVHSPLIKMVQSNPGLNMSLIAQEIASIWF